MKRVSIVDYGTSNLLSVARAFRQVGADVELVSDPKRLGEAGHLVVPGVGAFGTCIQAMGKQGFVEGVVDHIHEGKPYLGICVGMQMMFEFSEEFGRHSGLGVIAGAVKPIPAEGADGLSHKIPHIGWRPLRRPNGADWSGTPLQAAQDGESYYFVHSFTGVPTEPESLLAVADYDGIALTAAVRVKNALGVQFHPEKSGEAGLRMLSHFVAYN